MLDGYNTEDELKLHPSGTGFYGDTAVKGKRLLLIAGALLGLTAVVYFLASYIKKSHINTAIPEHKAAEATPSGPNYFFDMPDLVTNLSPTNDKEGIMKLAMTFQLNNSKDQSVVDEKLSMIKDSIVIFLRELRATDLASSGGSLMLKTELLKRINKVLYPVELKDILFREILLNQ